MKIKSIRFKNIRNLSPAGVRFEVKPSNLSLLSIANKSELATILDCIHAVLYEKDIVHNRLIYSLKNASGCPPIIELEFLYNDKNYLLRKQFLTETSTFLYSFNDRYLKKGKDAHDWLRDNIFSYTIKNKFTAIVWANQGAIRENTVTEREKHKSLYTIIKQEMFSLYNHSVESKLLTGIQSELRKNFTSTGRMKKKQEEEILSELEKTKTEITEKELQIERCDSLKKEYREISEQIKDFQSMGGIEKALDIIRKKEINTKIHKIRCDLEYAKRKLSRLKALEQLHKRNLIYAHESKMTVKKDFENAVRSRDNALRLEFGHIMNTVLEKSEDSVEFCENLEFGIRKLSKNLDEISVTESNYEELRGEVSKQDKLNLINSLGSLSITSRLTDLGYSKVTINNKKPILKQKTLSRTEINIDEYGVVVVESIASNLNVNCHNEQAKRVLDLLQRLSVSCLDEAENMLIERREIENKLLNLLTLLKFIAPNGVSALQESHDLLVNQSEKWLLRPLENEEVEEYDNTVDKLRYQKQRYESAMERICTDEKKHHEAILNTKSLKAAIEEKEKELIDYEKQLVGKGDLSLTINKLEGTKDVNAKFIFNCGRIDDKVDKKKALSNELDNWFQQMMDFDRKKIRLEEITRELEEFSKLETKKEIDKLLKQKKCLEKKLESNEIRYLALRRIEVGLEDNYTPLCRELLPLLKIVYPDAGISPNSHFNIKEFQKITLEKEKMVELENGATREQIAVLTRLAFAQLMSKRGREMPVVLEEPFVQFDSSRMENMFRALRSVSRKSQCIVVTCHEKSFSTLGATKLKLVPWSKSE